MAAPPEVTIKDLSGSWVMNKTLSDDTDATLALQGVGWWTRKAISLATVYLAIKQYPDTTSTTPLTHIDIDQTATGGIKGTTENRILDWTSRTHEDHVFGTIAAQSRWTSFEEIDDEFFKEGWLEFEEEKGGPNGEFHVESLAINEEKGWNTRQVWGFAIIDGERHYTRRIVTTKGEEKLKIRLVYNYLGKE